MRSADIRRVFFDFFTSRGHTRVPSSSLVPHDPTLLLANAGMNQFKPYFLGETPPPYPRAVSVQKCARTSDIENVGRTTRHATFFEMLGNFSFGDYFKTEAIAFAWELLTEHYRLDPERLWITVYRDDDEAIDLWRAVGVPAERIQRLGMADNFWSTGGPGPCGPCSEVCYDRGPAFGPDGGPAVNGERYLEIWNLVFMQSVRGHGGSKDDFPIVGALPHRSIDTGLGLDRLAAILQNVDTVCQTDLLAPTLATVEHLTGRAFPGRDGSEASVSFQIVTEHARSTAFLIADGVLPANEGRGYVLRRLMRRAIRHARTLGITRPVLAEVVGSVIDNLGADWPELAAHRNLINAVVTREEETFTVTLRQGTRLLDAAIARTRTAGATRLAGETAFELHDTYGFPIDLTLEAAQTAGLSVDQDRYAELLDQQRRRAKNSGKSQTAAALRRQDLYRALLAEHGRTDFVGYHATSTDTWLLALLVDGRSVPAAHEGDQVEIVIGRSPFYAESGGQVGDTGTLTPGDATIQVTDTRYGLAGFQILTGRITSGEARPGQTALAVVDADRRAATARSHSATHVLHAMLRRSLGDHARQQGSLVAPGRLRFDFTHFAPINPDDLHALGVLVNDYLLTDPEVRIWEASRAEAEAADATAFFGDRYGDTVRIVDIGDASRELCGGTHVGHGTQAGPVRILSESSIGAGLRRVEALTGRDALRYADHEHRLLHEITSLIGGSPDQLIGTLTTRLTALTTAEKALADYRRRELDTLAGQIAAGRREIHDGIVITTQVCADITSAELRTLASAVLAHLPGGAVAGVVLATSRDGKAHLVAALTPALHARGADARQILTGAAATIGGGTGGNDLFANAGGRRTDTLDHALAQAAAALTTSITAF